MNNWLQLKNRRAFARRHKNQPFDRIKPNELLVVEGVAQSLPGGHAGFDQCSGGGSTEGPLEAGAQHVVLGTQIGHLVDAAVFLFTLLEHGTIVLAITLPADVNTSALTYGAPAQATVLNVRQ